MIITHAVITQIITADSYLWPIEDYSSIFILVIYDL